MKSNNTIDNHQVVQNLVERVRANAWKKIEIEPHQRVFHLDVLPVVPSDVFHRNIKHTAEWLQESITKYHSRIILYVGFEIFFDQAFDNFCFWLKGKFTTVPVVFSSLVKSTREYIQQKQKYIDMEASNLTSNDWQQRVIIHLGAPNGMDLMLFQEDPHGHIQLAWNEGRLVVLSPDLSIVDQYAYHSSLLQVFNDVTSKLKHDSKNLQNKCEETQTIPCDLTVLDKNIQTAKDLVAKAQTVETVLAELYRFVSSYVGKCQLDSPCYFDTGFESIHLYKSISKLLEQSDMKIPLTRVSLINSRNGAIGDSCHAFYSSKPGTFPITVVGDTAAVLAGGLTMLSIQSNNRYGVVIVLNNHGMAIEDVISKRSIDGHSYQYEYATAERKRDIFSLEQLKLVMQDVLNSLRSHLWGVSEHRSNAIILNIDVPSLRKEIQGSLPMRHHDLDENFGDRFVQLEGPRKKLEAVVNVLYDALNADIDNKDSHRPVKIVGCSAVEFMEVFSHVAISLRDKMCYLPMPTDLLATRTLLPSLIESTGRSSNFVNSNRLFSVFVSNSIFGLDGLNNLISVHLEYGTRKLVHLMYDAAESVAHYSFIGQAHRNYGIRNSTVLTSLYRSHQSYEGQILIVQCSGEDFLTKIHHGLKNPDVKVILVDMGAPDLINYKI
jgi:hypothetical protein